MLTMLKDIVYYNKIDEILLNLLVFTKNLLCFQLLGEAIITIPYQIRTHPVVGKLIFAFIYQLLLRLFFIE